MGRHSENYLRMYWLYPQFEQMIYETAIALAIPHDLVQYTQPMFGATRYAQSLITSLH